jgi:peptidoglycan hydrolase CwlO-like protein
MKRHTYTQIILFAAAFTGMGMSLPSCPGDKAMQQQIDMLQQNNADMTRKLQALNGQIQSLGADLGSQKQVMTQLASTVAAQKEAIDNIYGSVKALQSRPVPAPPRPATPSKAKAKSKSKSKPKSKKRH